MDIILWSSTRSFLVLLLGLPGAWRLHLPTPVLQPLHQLLPLLSLLLQPQWSSLLLLLLPLWSQFLFLLLLRFLFSSRLLLLWILLLLLQWLLLLLLDLWFLWSLLLRMWSPRLLLLGYIAILVLMVSIVD
jgi:hypothetical protein